MRSTFGPRAAALLVLAASLARPAAAQFTNPYTGRTWNNPLSSYLDTAIRGEMQRKMLEEGYRRKDAGRKAPTAKKGAAHAALTVSDFRPEKKYVLPRELSGAAAGADEKTREAFHQLYLAILNGYRQQAPRFNVAQAIGFAVAASVLVKHGREMPGSEQDEIVGALNDALARSKAFARLTDRQRQLTYEAFVLTGGLGAYLHQEGTKSKNHEVLRQAADLADFTLATVFP